MELLSTLIQTIRWFWLKALIVQCMLITSKRSSLGLICYRYTYDFCMLLYFDNLLIDERKYLFRVTHCTYVTWNDNRLNIEMKRRGLIDYTLKMIIDYKQLTTLLNVSLWRWDLKLNHNNLSILHLSRSTKHGSPFYQRPIFSPCVDNQQSHRTS